MVVAAFKFQIRSVSNDDIEALVALWSEVFPEYNDPAFPQRDPRTNIARKLQRADGLFWVAISETSNSAEILGSVMGGYDGHRGWIYTLGVHPDHRRCGVATALLTHAEHEIEALGCVKINMQVMAGNAAALAFYAAHGYKNDAVTSIGKRIGQHAQK